MRKYSIIALIVIVLSFMSFASYCYYIKTYNNYYKAPIPKVEDISLTDDNNILIKYKIDTNSNRNKIYYMFKEDNITPDINDTNWKVSTSNEISLKLDENIYYAFLKNEDNIIINIDETSKLGKITYLKFNKDKIYLPLKGTYTPTLVYDTIGNVDETITWTSSNPRIVSVSNNGSVSSLQNGNSKICAQIMDEKECFDVISTKLIVKKPKTYDYDKPYLPCGKHSEKDNDLLDEILKDRIDTAGYKTRAGVVEAARFLALEFPYRIRYFSENGNVNTNKIDSEGRFYHKGLYLDESRYKIITKSFSGPKTWGCKLYSRPAHGQRPNGLDCSGFVSWVIYNGGYNVGDLGAGVTSNKDLTDIGKRTVFKENLIKEKKVKVGDLLSAGGPGGGHIAILIGEDNKNYYVAESLWTFPNIGVVVKKYSKKKIFNEFYYVMLMDSYYKKDGNITKMWY